MGNLLLICNDNISKISRSKNITIIFCSIRCYHKNSVYEKIRSVHRIEQKLKVILLDDDTLEIYYWYVMILFPKYHYPKISPSFSAQFDVIIKIHFIKKFDQYIEFSRNWWWYFWMMILWKIYYGYVMIVFPKYHHPKISLSFSAQFDVIIFNHNLKLLPRL